MRAAANNLVPLTLELGGKSPVIISRKRRHRPLTAARVMNGKTLNAGQICLAPDYVLTPEARASASSSPRRKRAVDQACSRPSRTIPTTPPWSPSGTMTGSWATSTTPAPRGPRSSRSSRTGEDLSQQEHRKIAADPDPQPDRRHEGHAGRDLRPGAAGEDLQDPRRGQQSTTSTAHDRPLGLYWFGTDEAEKATVLNTHHQRRRHHQ